MATPVTVQCPNCERQLKIKDRALFGSKVKCPGCGKPFLLPDPDLPVAKPVAQPSAPAAAPPPPGPAAAPPPRNPFEFGAPAAPSADTPLFPRGKQAMDFLHAEDHSAASPPAAKFPQSPPQFPQASPQFPQASPQFPQAAPQFPQAAPQFPSAAPQFPQASPQFPQAAPAPLDFGAAGAIGSGTQELYRLRKNRKQGMWLNIALMVLVLGAGGGTIAYFATRSQPAPATTVAATPAPAAATSEQMLPPENEPYSRALLESDGRLVKEFNPTQGKPIQLFMMPSGVTIVVHLRPAQLWSDGYDYRVLRASLTDDVTGWIASQLKELCHREPAQVEELTLGIITGARGTTPQVCAVVRFVEPQKMSDLIAEFPGNYLYDIVQKPEVRLKVDATHGYLLHDERTIAICPASLAGELEAWISTPNYEVSEDISELLERSDRERLFTFIGESLDLELHLKSLLPASAQPVVQQTLNWLGEDVTAIGWSVQPEPYLYSELFLRPATTVDVRQLETEMRKKISTLPETVWKQVCAKMSPREMRFRQLIGRLPAMLEAFQRSTVTLREKRCLELTTVLPAKAAPNLALATMFTVNEASRTNFQTATTVATSKSTKNTPQTIVEKLKTPVDAEFNRTPLEQALQYLCDEAQIKLYVDGDALKDAGYTKNMPQTFNLGKVPMQRALFEIVNNYQERNKEMVVSIDEGTKTLTVLTKKFADAKGMPVYPLKPE